MKSWSDIPGTYVECVTFVGLVVKTRSNKLLSLVELLWTCVSWTLSVMSMRYCEVDRSELQVFTFPISHDLSRQLKSPQRIICLCFEFLVIFVRDILSSCMALLHRCGM